LVMSMSATTPLVISRDGTIGTLEATEMPLGLGPRREICGRRGCSFRAIESNGLERLRNVIMLHAEASSDRVHEAILDDVRAFTQATPQADDITLVVLGYDR